MPFCHELACNHVDVQLITGIQFEPSVIIVGYPPDSLINFVSYSFQNLVV